MRMYSAIALLMSISVCNAQEKAVIVGLIGDSTVAVQSGWGPAFAERFNRDVKIVNFAKNGATLEALSKELDALVKLKPDYVLIQFGHNDQKRYDTTVYSDHLKSYVERIRKSGGKAVIVSSVTRRSFDAHGKIVSNLVKNEEYSYKGTLTDYANAAEAVARELNLPFIDLHGASIAHHNKIGREESMSYNFKEGDKTHFNRKGAEAITNLILKEIENAVPEISTWLKSEQELAAFDDAALPNIILMMSDDHGWEETGYNGHPHLKTPVLDEMASTGLKFEHFSAAHPSCSPTRASFLTSRHPNRMGTFAPGWSMRPEEITVAHLLANAGYRCMHFGKWHVGAVKAGSPLNPGSMGFHEWLSHDNFFELDPPLSRNGGPPEVFKGESSEILIREAIAGIGRARDSGKPVFQVIWFGSPHEPYSGLTKDLAIYDDLPEKYPKMVHLTSNETGNRTLRPQGEVLRERYAEITAMDRAIGMLRKHLAESDLRDNTLLFYCSDNGTSAESALGFPHRGAKGEIYEGGTLVPGVIEWPARIPKPRTTRFRACTSDLLPTLAALTRQPLPDRPLDGVDLMPVIDGTLGTRPSPLRFWVFDSYRVMASNLKPYIDSALQEGTTPLVKLSGGKATRDFRNYTHPAISDTDFLGPRAIIDGDHKLVVREKNGQPSTELFDLRTDPAEKTNLIDQKPELARKLKTDLLEWQNSVLKSLTGEDYHGSK